MSQGVSEYCLFPEAETEASLCGNGAEPRFNFSLIPGDHLSMLAHAFPSTLWGGYLVAPTLQRGMLRPEGLQDLVEVTQPFHETRLGTGDGSQARLLRLPGDPDPPSTLCAPQLHVE